MANYTFLALFLFLSNSAVSAQSLQGTWQLQSGEYLNQDEDVIEYADLEMQALKIITATHYSFISQAKGKFWASGAGTYVSSEGSYIETPLFASYSLPESATFSFTYKLEGDTWTKERWEKGQRQELEVWKRIE